jgi:hypothetical protein
VCQSPPPGTLLADWADPDDDEVDELDRLIGRAQRLLAEWHRDHG